ncbi:MAG: acyl-CoA/acyl-ACP dehydrogenase [Proteobacteria bacterium]|nr:acyl-CoA/acyl-ACP dehydrogenase [Pseudomonadota bacterium]
MAYTEINMAIGKESLAMQKEVRDFAMKVVRPAGVELDQMHDPADVIAKDSVLWDVIKKYREMNLHQQGVAPELGGLGEIDPMSSILIHEELGYADPGLAISLMTSGIPYFLAAMSPEKELQDLVHAYCEDTSGELFGCWCMMEPEHGSDWVLSAQPGFDDPARVPTVRAVKKGDEYIITGQKAAWVSNATIATHGVVHLNLDPSLGMRGDGIAIVPLDLPGVSKGKPLKKLGQRSLNQGEIFFDEVKIPEKYMVIPVPEMGTMVKDGLLVMGNTTMGQIFTGAAQAAFDEALDYAKNRIQGGKPIFEHQNVRLKIFKMFTMVESIRTFSRQTALYNLTNRMMPSAPHAMASKVLATENAFQVASDAVQIFGGNGLTQEYIVEKIFRDTRSALIEDGENSVLSLMGASHL